MPKSTTMSDKNFSDHHRSFKLSQQALIFNDEGEILILQSTEYQHQWLLPGGRVDKDETDLEAALAREIFEEANLRMEKIVKPIWFDVSLGGSTYAILFEVRVENISDLKLSPEHISCKWINPKDENLVEHLFYKNLAKKINQIYSN